MSAAEEQIIALLEQLLGYAARLDWWIQFVIGIAFAGLAVYFICRPLFYFIRK